MLVDRGIVTSAAISEKFTNEGTLRKSVGSSTSYSRVGVPFKNQGGGLLDVAAGAVWFSDEAEQAAGTTQIATNAKLQVTNTYSVKGGTIEAKPSSTIAGHLKLTDGTFYVGGQGTVGTVTVVNHYTQTGGTLHIDINDAEPAQDRLVVGNIASLGGNLTVNTIAAITSRVTILSGLRAPAPRILRRTPSPQSTTPPI